MICGDDRFETDAPRWTYTDTANETEEYLGWLDGFYEQPFCRKCKYNSSRRNHKPITLTYAPGKYDGASGSIGSHGAPDHKIVSEEFLALLTEDEKRRLHFQPTLRRGRKRFLELVGPEGPPHVAVAGMEISGWRCTDCGHRTWGYWIKEMAIHSFVARADLPGGEGVFTVGTFPEIELAVTGPRWREMLGRKGTRGFASQPLGVVPDHEVVRKPELPTPKEERSRDRSATG